MLRFTSVLEKHSRETLEQLMFFHPQQGRIVSNLISSVAEQGSPRIVDHDGKLRVEIPRIQDVQTLYAVIEDALNRELVGMVVYARLVPDELTALHMAVKEEYTMNGPKADQMIAYHLLEELRRIGNRIQGIRGIRLAYHRRRTLLATGRTPGVSIAWKEKP